jgi:hypothetical protein
MKKYDVVIARYKENIDWLDQLDDKFNIIIYNKGPEDISRPCIISKNPGNASESFIRYIVEHYDNLPEFVIFLQAYPFDHCKDLVYTLNNHIDRDFIVLCDDVFTESINGWYEPLIKKPNEFQITYLRDVTRKILGNEFPSLLKFGAGEQYLVASKYIKNRSKEFYQKILDMYKDDYLLPWHMERLYMTIWGIK